jgi:glycerophosphoryl diester phosphodiesterase
MNTCFTYAFLLAYFVGEFVVNRPSVEIIAHRGASEDAPENTMAAFRLGWEQKADANELDIHLTKDGQIAVMHDLTTKRTAALDKAIAQQTLAELRELDAGQWKGEQWQGEKIPTLSESLAVIPAGKRVFIEIKCGPEVLPELERILKASGKSSTQLVIIGFEYETMKLAKARFPQLLVYWLVSPKKETQGRQPPVAELIEMAKAAKLDGLNLNYKFAMDAQFVAQVKDSGLKLYVWTVDDLDVAEKLVQLGVDGITTNRPAWLREQLTK